MRRILVVTTNSETRASAARVVAELGCSVEFGRTPAKTEDGACAHAVTGSRTLTV
jgi:hypothetical protein